MDTDSLRIKLIESICRMSPEQLLQTSDWLRANEPQSTPPRSGSGGTTVIEPTRPWPHAPLHRLSEQGTYMVTSGTHQKGHIFRDAERLNVLEKLLLELAHKYERHLEAWAIFSNHYHFVGYTLSAPSRLREFLSELHANSARELNRMDRSEGRKVWHNFWDKQLTFEKSYLARLNYVHQNAVRHGLVTVANQYPWCSAAWFERIAKPAQVKTIYSFKTDRLQIADDFEPQAIFGGTRGVR